MRKQVLKTSKRVILYPSKRCLVRAQTPSYLESNLDPNGRYSNILSEIFPVISLTQKNLSWAQSHIERSGLDLAFRSLYHDGTISIQPTQSSKLEYIKMRDKSDLPWYFFELLLHALNSHTVQFLQIRSSIWQNDRCKKLPPKHSSDLIWLDNSFTSLRPLADVWVELHSFRMEAPMGTKAKTAYLLFENNNYILIYIFVIWSTIKQL